LLVPYCTCEDDASFVVHWTVADVAVTLDTDTPLKVGAVVSTGLGLGVELGWEPGDPVALVGSLLVQAATAARLAANKSEANVGKAGAA
jgi:hypothetical protein